jgi:hypothetical protein
MIGYAIKNIEELKERPDIISKIRFDITPRTIMEPLFTETGEFRKVDLSGYFFYIETESERPGLMLMKVSKTTSMKTIGIIEDLPQDLLKRAIENPVHSPIHGMYAITEEIKEWICKNLSITP